MSRLFKLINDLKEMKKKAPRPVSLQPASTFDWSQRAVPISAEAQRQATAYQQRPRIPTVPFGSLFSGAGGMTYT